MRSLFLLALMTVAPQPAPPAVTFEQLRAAVASGGPAPVQELTVRWDVYAAPAEPVAAPDRVVPVNQFELLARRVLADPPQRERNPELSADQLVVVGADAGGAPLSWQLIRDPRIVRAETPGPDGVLSGTVLHRREIDFLVALPAPPALAQVRIYQPRWTGFDWALDLIGSVSAPREPR